MAVVDTLLAGAGTLLPRWATRAGLPLALTMLMATLSGVAPLSFTCLVYGWPLSPCSSPAAPD